MIASVFVNRLKSAMPLQSDPTVIYGLGASFDGNLRKKDLLADTPYNTYTRSGLPPSPISMPGLAALRAVFNPANGNFLYFVARGDGSSEFSRTLDEHNRAVMRFQKGNRRWNLERGRFITFEGIDGAGKSTQITATVEWVKARGVEVVQSREPGGSPLGERAEGFVAA